MGLETTKLDNKRQSFCIQQNNWFLQKVEMRERMFSTFRNIVSELQLQAAIANLVKNIFKQPVLQGAGGDK